MSALAAVQQRLHAALLDPAGDPGAAPALFQPGGRLDPAAGLAIYQRGYFLRIAACMREQFPALCHALGRALFDDFVADYLRACPPERHTLYDLGRRFAGWIAANRPEAEAPEPWVDFMIDLARFEYGVFTLFDAEGDEARGYATAATPDAALRLQRAFALGAYRFPVAGYYHAVRRGEAPALPLAAPTYVALVRRDFLTRTVPLSEAHHALLTAIQGGQAVTAALAHVCARYGFDPGEAERGWHSADGVRARWIDWGFFVAADSL